MPFEKAYADVGALVQKFKANEAYYLSPQYKEAELRLHFLDEFWTALGWDVRHREQTNPREQEVKIELSDAASYLKPDYAFFLKPNFERPVFLVEAKKPFGTLETQDNYFQTARYGFNHATTVAVLTDFQEFHLIDCRRKPEFVPGIIACGIKDGKYRYTDFLEQIGRAHF